MLNKIYVCIPGNVVTGGPETLHQFAEIVSQKIKNTYVYYFGKETEYKIPEKYRKYHITTASSIEDSEDNLMILPEVFLGLSFQYSKIHKCIWWLSVDNYYYSNRRYIIKYRSSNKSIIFKYLDTFKSLGGYLYRRILGRTYTIEELDDNVTHLYNCEYAKLFLLEHGVPENRTFYLCGPLEKIYFDCVDKEKVLKSKKDIIVYNPTKGYNYVKRLIKENENKYLFVPIQNMSSEQVRNLLLSAKLYIDFGYFPGPERIPRQAAMCYCSILTSKSGSACNEIDVPINSQNKIDVKHFDVKSAYKKIEMLMENFENDVQEYDNYRVKITEQNSRFKGYIAEFLEKY